MLLPQPFPKPLGGAPLQLILFEKYRQRNTKQRNNDVISNFPKFKDADWPSLTWPLNHKTVGSIAIGQTSHVTIDSQSQLIESHRGDLIRLSIKSIKVTQVECEDFGENVPFVCEKRFDWIEQLTAIETVSLHFSGKNIELNLNESATNEVKSTAEYLFTKIIRRKLRLDLKMNETRQERPFNGNFSKNMQISPQI